MRRRGSGGFKRLSGALSNAGVVGVRVDCWVGRCVLARKGEGWVVSAAKAGRGGLPPTHPRRGRGWPLLKTGFHQAASKIPLKVLLGHYQKCAQNGCEMRGGGLGCQSPYSGQSLGVPLSPTTSTPTGRFQRKPATSATETE